jgi:polyhydroxyalkanoate synthase
VATAQRDHVYIDPESWQMNTKRQEGSWWPAWEAWLTGHSTGGVAPAEMGAAGAGYPVLEEAPGTYVFQV